LTYDPEIWLESAVREIKNYTTAGITALVPNGTSVYDVVMEFPGPALDDSKNPLQKTLIHFEIDDMRDGPVGLGENIFADNYDPDTGSVKPQYAGTHLINFDVGVWASAKSGGVTARLRAKQLLFDLFGSPKGMMEFHAYTDGGDGRVEVISFQGGRNIADKINDVPVYRTIDGQLVVRVYSRTALSDTAEPAIEEIIQAPELEIIDQGENLIILG
jgi:hypothetical protein